MLWHVGRALSYGEGVAFWALAAMVPVQALRPADWVPTVTTGAPLWSTSPLVGVKPGWIKPLDVSSYTTRARPALSISRPCRSHLLTAAAANDAYVSPLLRDRPSRRHTDSRPLEGQYAWLDADDWDDDRHAELVTTGAEVWSVASGGGPGNRHLEPPGHPRAGWQLGDRLGEGLAWAAASG